MDQFSPLQKVAFFVARVAGAGAGLLGTGLVMAGGGLAPAFGVAFALLSLGLWMLWPLALRAGTVVLLLLAIVVPLGVVNPFYASQAAASGPLDEDFVARTLIVGFGGSLVCLACAWLINQARLARQPQRKGR